MAAAARQPFHGCGEGEVDARPTEPCAPALARLRSGHCGVTDESTRSTRVPLLTGCRLTTTTRLGTATHTRGTRALIDNPAVERARQREVPLWGVRPSLHHRNHGMVA